MKNNITKLIAVLVLFSFCISTLSPSVAKAWSAEAGDVGTNHQTLSEFAVAETNFTAAEKQIVKLGSVAADRYFKYEAGYPSLHGFDNYIEAFTYISTLASTITTTTTFPVNTSMSTEKKQINSALATISGNWAFYLDYATVTTRNVRLFVLGMSLHMASDVYAHNAVVHVVDSTIPMDAWVPVTHTQTTANKAYFKYISCDLSSATPSRYDVAKWVCRYTVEKWVNGTERNYLLFKFYREDFRLNKLYTYSGYKPELLAMSIND